MKNLIVEKTNSGIKLARPSTKEFFSIENNEVFGLILKISEVTDYDSAILCTHKICLEVARKQNS